MGVAGCCHAVSKMSKKYRRRYQQFLHKVCERVARLGPIKVWDIQRALCGIWLVHTLAVDGRVTHQLAAGRSPS